MESLTRTLIAQHRVAEGLIQVVHNALARGDRRVLQEAVNRLGQAIQAHLELEDGKLYPALREAARAGHDPAAAQVAAQFASSMASISRFLTAFFERYRWQEIDLGRFAGEWGSVAQALKARITAEELSLYPLHARLERPVSSSGAAGRAAG